MEQLAVEQLSSMWHGLQAAGGNRGRAGLGPPRIWCNQSGASLGPRFVVIGGLLEMLLAPKVLKLFLCSLEFAPVPSKDA